MNIQQIKYILAVSNTRHFGDAAVHCNVTQSTLSTMIAKFEEEIGVTIFYRKKKPVTVTKEGENIIEQLKIIVREIDRLQVVVQTMKGNLSGEITIGVIPTISPYLLPLFLNEFTDLFPKIHFSINEMTTQIIIEKIERRELDIGILSVPLNRPELLEIPLYNEPFLLFDQADKSGQDEFNIQNLDFDRLWILDEGHCMRTQVENICGFKQPPAPSTNMEYRSGTIDTLLKFVISNNGLTLVPLLSTLDFNEEKRLHLQQFETPIPVRSVGLVVHENFVKKEILKILQQKIEKNVLPILGEIKLEQILISPI